MTAPKRQPADQNRSRPAGEELSAERKLEQLMEGYQQADTECAAELVRQVSPVLFRYFCGHTRSVPDAQDLLQEAWLRIHRARHTYRPGLPVLPWLFAIAEHTRIDAYRSRIRRSKREIAVEQLPEPARPSEAPSAARIDVQEILAKLPAGQREVLLLLKFSGLSLEEVARLKGTTLGAVKLRAHRAYQALRSLFPGKAGAA